MRDNFRSGQWLDEVDSARNKLRQLLVRESELHRIEQSLVEVRDMFLRISTLVMEQVSISRETVCFEGCVESFVRN